MKDQIDRNVGGYSDGDFLVTRKDLHSARSQFLKYMIIADLDIDFLFRIAVDPDW